MILVILKRHQFIYFTLHFYFVRNKTELDKCTTQ